MTATDELIRLLEERGEDFSPAPNGMVTWYSDFSEITAYENDGFLTVWNLTPNQAINGTLGPERCQITYCEDEYGVDGWRCSGCGEWFAATFRHTGRNNLIEPNWCPNCGARVWDLEKLCRLEKVRRLRRRES